MSTTHKKTLVVPQILAIDTSCDDTSASVTVGRVVRSNVIASQSQLHQKYGGVFPTVAKAAHRERIAPSVQLALDQASVNWAEIDAIAVTLGPGLAPALEVGIQYAQELAATWHKPLIGVNHISAHALSVLAVAASRHKTLPTQLLELEQAGLPPLPALAVVISGGHSLFALVQQPGRYEILGQSIDDAAGECLDKVGRALNLGYPAGPVLEHFARQGKLGRYQLPRAMQAQANFDLSFSGLKTAARSLINQLSVKQHLNAQATRDLAAELQAAVFGQITYKLERILLSPDLAARSYPSRHYLKQLSASTASPSPIQSVWLGGGVAANTELRRQLRRMLQQHKRLTGQTIPLLTPYSKKLCADNAAMIGVAAYYQWLQGGVAQGDKLERRPSWKIY